MSELSDRLKAFLTPEQRDELRLALAACDSWLNPTPPKSSDPEKVINWREGDWWSVLDDGKVLWLNSHDMCIDVVDFYKGRNCWGARINGHTRLTDSEGDARAAALGYTIIRKPTPASDSVRGERDTANPAASAKHDQFPMGAGDVTGPGESPWEAIGKLAGEIYELKREVAELTIRWNNRNKPPQ